MDVARKGPLLALLVLGTASCGRNSGAYSAFAASHDAIRPGMSFREVFEAGLADYMLTGQGANISGTTTSTGEPASPECLTHVVDVHYGSGDFMHAGGFSIGMYCATSRTPPKAIAPPRVFQTKRDFLQGLDAHYASWIKSMQFDIQSPALQIGGVYDSYNFSVDEHGKVATVSAIRLANP